MGNLSLSQGWWVPKIGWRGCCSLPSQGMMGHREPHWPKTRPVAGCSEDEKKHVLYRWRCKIAEENTESRSKHFRNSTAKILELTLWRKDELLVDLCKNWEPPWGSKIVPLGSNHSLVCHCYMLHNGNSGFHHLVLAFRHNRRQDLGSYTMFYSIIMTACAVLRTGACCWHHC